MKGFRQVSRETGQSRLKEEEKQRQRGVGGIDGVEWALGGVGLQLLRGL